MEVGFRGPRVGSRSRHSRKYSGKGGLARRAREDPCGAVGDCCTNVGVCRHQRYWGQVRQHRQHGSLVADDHAGRGGAACRPAYRPANYRRRNGGREQTGGLDRTGDHRAKRDRDSATRLLDDSFEYRTRELRLVVLQRGSRCADSRRRNRCRHQPGNQCGGWAFRDGNEHCRAGSRVGVHQRHADGVFRNDGGIKHHCPASQHDGAHERKDQRRFRCRGRSTRAGVRVDCRRRTDRRESGYRRERELRRADDHDHAGAGRNLLFRRLQSLKPGGRLGDQQLERGIQSGDQHSHFPASADRKFQRSGDARDLAALFSGGRQQCRRLVQAVRLPEWWRDGGRRWHRDDFFGRHGCAGCRGKWWFNGLCAIQQSGQCARIRRGLAGRRDR